MKDGGTAVWLVSIDRMPELKCLRGFPDHEPSKAESKIYRFPTDLRKQLASPPVIILSKILGLRALQIEIFSVLQF